MDFNPRHASTLANQTRLRKKLATQSTELQHGSLMYLDLKGWSIVFDGLNDSQPRSILWRSLLSSAQADSAE